MKKELLLAIKEKETQLAKLKNHIDKSYICSELYNKVVLEKAILKKELDNPSIGLLLCKSKNNVVAEYSLKDISKPIGVSEYKITSSLPDDLEKQLPSVEDIQKRIK